jgi:predicted DNA-binding protein
MKNTTIKFRISQEEKDKLFQLAKSNNATLSNLLRELIQREVDENWLNQEDLV